MQGISVSGALSTVPHVPPCHSHECATGHGTRWGSLVLAFFTSTFMPACLLNRSMRNQVPTAIDALWSSTKSNAFRKGMPGAMLAALLKHFFDSEQRLSRGVLLFCPVGAPELIQ